MEPVKNETNGSLPQKENIPEYGKVVLTLNNCLLPEEKLNPTPSSLDGLDAETEADLRILGCELIQTAGILLQLPQVAMATAQVMFQRFFFSKSFIRQSWEVTGMGCLYLASKIEEAPRRIRDVINVYHHIKQVNSGKKPTPMILDQNFYTLKYQVIKAERRVLKELGFCVHVKHPHKLIVLYLQVIGFEAKQNLMQIAWNYMNDSLRTDVFVRYQPETVACACIYLTARKLKIPMPRSPPWFAVFNVEEKDIQDISTRILQLYVRTKPKTEDLEKKVQELVKQIEATRQKNRIGIVNPASGTNTPTSVVNDKKDSPKRSHSDRSRSRTRSRTPSDSPRKRYKKSRSRSHEKYNKKSRFRRSRSNSPSYKSYKDKRYRSRSRSTDREVSRDVSRNVSRDLSRDTSREATKYVSDRYREARGVKYRPKGGGDEKQKEGNDDEWFKKEDVYKRGEFIRKDEAKSRKDDDTGKLKRNDDDDRYGRDEDSIKHRKEDERRKKDDDNHKHKKDKVHIRDDEPKKRAKHNSSKHRNSGEKRKRKKHYDSGLEEDDDVEILENLRRKN